jgi:heat shock protein HtpX
VIFLFFLPLISLCVFTGLLFLMYTVYRSHPEDSRTKNFVLSLMVIFILGFYSSLSFALIERGSPVAYVGIFFLVLVIFILGRSLIEYMYSTPHLRALRAVPLQNEKILRLSREMAQKFRVAQPEVYITHYEVPNAFTLGRKKQPKLVITDGLLDLTYNEVKAVFAHELAHVKANDSLVKTVASVMRKFLFFDPVTRFVYSRIYVEKEFVADERSVRVTGDPKDLISALRKIYKEISEFGEGLPSQSVLNFSQKIYDADSLRYQQGIPTDPILRNRFIVERKMMPGSVVRARVEQLTKMEKHIKMLRRKTR